MKLHKVRGQACDVLIGIDDTSAEQWAMLGAMYSRSSSSAEELIEKVKPDNASGFMSKFYVGYGHESIGDLVDVKLFIEHVPFYVACQLEHFSRFRGQESSTRYIDFSKQPSAVTADPVTYRAQIENYTTVLNQVRERITVHYSQRHDHSEMTPTIKRAINARAFDICRALLPWGATTNVAWYGDIRTIQQHLSWLESSRNANRDITNISLYTDTIRAALAYVYPSSILKKIHVGNNYPAANEARPDYIEGMLDFGSWRDLNRHRLARQFIDMQRVGGLHPWYLEMLGKGMEYTCGDSIDARLLGQVVSFSCEVMSREHGAYLSRLRTGISVHPTLRQVMANFADHKKLPHTPYIEIGPYGFYEARGDQTITHMGKEL